MILRGIIFYLNNTTAGLAILTSISYFYAGISKKGFAPNSILNKVI